MFDLVIQGKTLMNGSLEEANILINEGMIEEIRRLPPSSGEYGEIHRFGSKLLLPGVIDLHTHMREPGMEYKENFRTGTISAAFGGATAIVDMPNTKPPTTDMASFLEKKEKALSSSHVDVGLNIVIHDETVMDIKDPYFGDPCFAGFKVFMGETTGSLVLKDISRLKKISRMRVDDGFPISVHAEDGDHMDPRVITKENLLSSHLRSRPDLAESSAISKATSSMEGRENRLHLLHISSEKGLEAARVTEATIEATPHHLMLDVKNFNKFNDVEAFGKVNPPLRTPRDRSALWAGLRNGVIHTLGSDHAPHTISEKESEHPPSGMPGVETMLPIMLENVRAGKLELSRLISLLSENPARRLGLERRGSLKKGKIADILVVDLAERKEIRGEDLHSKCGWSSFEGMTGIFPVRVYGRGELLVEDESLCSKEGRGMPIRS